MTRAVTPSSSSSSPISALPREGSRTTRRANVTKVLDPDLPPAIVRGMTTASAPYHRAEARSCETWSFRRVGAVAVALILLSSHRNAVAGGAPSPVHLALPLLTSLAFGRSFLELHLLSGIDGQRAGFRDRARAALGFLPSALRVPDLYAVDVAEREPLRFAAPVDHTTYASFNLLPRRLAQGRSLSMSYATESLPAMGQTRAFVGLTFAIDF